MREDLHTSKGAPGAVWPDGVEFDPPPRPRRFPSELALRWTPVRPRSADGGRLRVLIEQLALQQIRRHVSRACEGAAGLLTGDLNRCPESGQLWLSVEQASPGSGSVPDEGGAGALDGVVSPLIRDRALHGQRAIGWYHAHSGLGVFLSPGEAEFHQLRFPEIWQVAIVFLEDSERPAAGVFLRAPDGALSRSGYVEFYERLHRSSLLPEGRKRSFVGWSNHTSEEPVVIAGSEGVPDDLSDPVAPSEAAPSGPPEPATFHGTAGDAVLPAGGDSEPGIVHYKGVTPAGSGPDGETGPSEEAHDRAQMKRALSAVDFSIAPPPDPAAGTLKADASRGSPNDDGPGKASARADPAPEEPATRPDTAGRPPTPTVTRYARPIHAGGVHRPSRPDLLPSSETSGAPPRHQRRSRHARKTGLGRIAWTALGLLLVCTLLWLVFKGGSRVVTREPAAEPALPQQPDARGAVTAGTESRPDAPDRAVRSASFGSLPAAGPTPEIELPEVDVSPEIAPPPAPVIIEEPFGGDSVLPVYGIEATGQAGVDTVAPVQPDSESNPLHAEFLVALEIFGQESAGYGERRDAFERGLVGCNALNSWYRSAWDAFVRLSRRVVEAGPEGAPIWRAGYERAQARMDEIDRHYLASDCPLPR